MTRSLLVAILALALASACPDTPPQPGDDHDDAAPYAPVCEQPPESACGNEGAWIQGTVRLSPDLIVLPRRGRVARAREHQGRAARRSGREAPVVADEVAPRERFL